MRPNANAKNPLRKLSGVDASSLPPCEAELQQHIHRSAFVQDFNDESVEHLQACLEATDWDTFKNVSDDLDEYTDTVTQYISFCVDSCIPTRTVASYYTNQKPFFTKDIRDKMHTRNEAFKRGDQIGYKTCRYQVINANKLAKRDYRRKLDT